MNHGAGIRTVIMKCTGVEMQLQTSRYRLESNQGSYECEARSLSSQGRYLHSTTQTQKKCRHTAFLRVGFEPTIPMFERAKEWRALHRTVTVIGSIFCPSVYINKASPETGFQTLFPNVLAISSDIRPSYFS
jgi:hypothetical protein